MTFHQIRVVDPGVKCLIGRGFRRNHHDFVFDHVVETQRFQNHIQNTLELRAGLYEIDVLVG